MTDEEKQLCLEFIKTLPASSTPSKPATPLCFPYEPMPGGPTAEQRVSDLEAKIAKLERELHKLDVVVADLLDSVSGDVMG